MGNQFYISLHAAKHAGNREYPRDVELTDGSKPLKSMTTSRTDPEEVYEVAKKFGDDYAASHPTESFTICLGVLGNTPAYRIYQEIEKLNQRWIKNIPDWAK